MILIEELKKMAKLRGMSMGNAEKDYLISLMLFIISGKTKGELVFKGGTCLTKFYGLDRFSEDIDFTAVKPLDIEKISGDIVSGMENFGIKCSLNQKREPYNSILLAFRCEGPLYKGLPMTFASVRMDINLKSTVDVEPSLNYYSPAYREIPRFSLLVMQEKEILAEKIRALLSRKKARDLYDLYFLISKKVEADPVLIKEKFKYYKQSWDIKEFEAMISSIESIWHTELKPLLKNVPDFEEVKKSVMEEANRWKM